MPPLRDRLIWLAACLYAACVVIAMIGGIALELVRPEYNTDPLFAGASQLIAFGLGALVASIRRRDEQSIDRSGRPDVEP